MSETHGWYTNILTPEEVNNLIALRTSAVDLVVNIAALYTTLQLLVCALETTGYSSTTHSALFCSIVLLASKYSKHRVVLWALVLVLALFCTPAIEGAFFMVGFYDGKVVNGCQVAVQGGREG
jgi:hypothetical protein